MVSTAVLLTAVLSSYAVMLGLVVLVVQVLGHRIDDVGKYLGARMDSVERRLAAVEEGVTGLRVDVARLDARLVTLEKRFDERGS